LNKQRSDPLFDDLTAKVGVDLAPFRPEATASRKTASASLGKPIDFTDLGAKLRFFQ
jgi:hypothetical protein